MTKRFSRDSVIRRSFTAPAATPEQVRERARRKAARVALPVPEPRAEANAPNSLKIMYPASTDVLPVETAVTVWIRYLDGNGQPKPNEPIHADMSGYASVYPADLPPTDENGYTTTQITFSKPGTLGTVASYDASLTVTAKNNSNDTDNADLHASTTEGGPLVITLDDTVNSADPNSTFITGGVWTMISGTCALSDGTPAPLRGISWDVWDPSGLIQPTLASPSTKANDKGSFCNFVLTSYQLSSGNLKISVQSTASSTSKTYPCIGGPAPFGTIDMALGVNWSTLHAGSLDQIFATYTRADHASPAGKPVNWFAAPEDAHFDYPNPTTTDGSGKSNNIARLPKIGDGYSEAIWAEITDNGARTRGALVNYAIDPFALSSGISLEVTSPDSNEFIPGEWHEIVATLKDGKNNPLVDQPIDWSATPADRFVFSQPYPTMTDSEGTARIHVMAVGLEPLVGAQAAWIEAHGSNHISGWQSYSRFFGSIGSQSCPITITSQDDATQLSLYQQHQLTATYHATDNKQKPISWLVVPDSTTDTHHFIFEPNPSPTNNSGQASTQLTAYGPNIPTNVVAYARAYDETTGEYDLSCPFQLSFVKGANPPADEGIIDVESIDGNPLSEGDLHLITATYTTFEGTPLAQQPITWTIDPANASNVQLLSTQPTLTDIDGVATNGVTAINTNNPFSATITATATNPFNAQEIDEGNLSLTFQAQVEQSGCMKLTSDDEPPLAIGKPHGLTVQYYEKDCQTAMPEGTPVYWTAFPANRIFFLENPTYTNSAGISTNTAIASKGANINNARIAVWSPNIETGINDHAELTTSYRTPITQNLLGVMINKAYTQNPPRGQKANPSKPVQVIKGQVQVLGQQGPQQVTLLTNPNPAAETMWKADGSAKLDNSTGNYVVVTDDNGVGTFLITSENYTMFDLNAQWKQQTLTNPTKLVIATNRQQQSTVLNPPMVPGITNGGTMQIPPAPFFKVQIPASKNVPLGSQVSLLLNDRLAYDGLADPALGNGVNVAYAALNLAGNNALVYVTPLFQESGPFTFNTSGTPQTGPNTGGAARVLDAPQVDVPDGSTITPKDILNGGLQVDLYPYSAMKPDEDVITMFFYLSGQDVLLSQLTPPQTQQVTNIVSVVYRLTSGSPLLAGNTVTLILPQQYVAGYINGQVQADYNVVNPTGGTRWSKLSSSYSLNTTF